LLDHGRGDWAMTIARRFLYDSSDAIRLDALAKSSWSPLAELVGKLVREERYHRMHAGAWLDRWLAARANPRPPAGGVGGASLPTPRPSSLPSMAKPT
jgi:ring-1,2-phenylacetyl-CoA epoxidase subunit PaaC